LRAVGSSQSPKEGYIRGESLRAATFVGGPRSQSFSREKIENSMEAARFLDLSRTKIAVATSFFLKVLPPIRDAIPG
jgi:hypothetical protein